jgi:hypothetical protein
MGLPALVFLSLPNLCALLVICSAYLLIDLFVHYWIFVLLTR